MRNGSETVTPTQGIAKIGERGAIVIPEEFRRRYGMEEGAYVLIQAAEEGLVINSAFVAPIEIYTPERKAEFLLNNAMSKEDYQWAVEEVRRMGLDPDKIPHEKPPGA
jgi:bifunctional DNA-binding transcriptional regulator/antitoxin component of YhaV-PrlF toxin-antitoxin module